METWIAANMEALWQHTQHPELHQQWDLRFSEITYLAGGASDFRTGN
ncbi:hypothetical protein [Paenibacillus sp. NEAU-GSW1]|nr:hypothetical protein [Paenibacillus sp. NEAU-GSW1]